MSEKERAERELAESWCVLCVRESRERKGDTPSARQRGRETVREANE